MRNKTDDSHESCKRALRNAYAAAADCSATDCSRIKQILQQRPDGSYHVLNVLRVDMFQDGLRIVVQ